MHFVGLCKYVESYSHFAGDHFILWGTCTGKILNQDEEGCLIVKMTLVV